MKHWREFTGRDWMLVDIANMFGWDKELYETRIEHAEGIISQGKDIALEMAEEADEKERYRYIRSVTEFFRMRDAVRQGEVPATGYRIGQDAGASGIQMFSAITGCASGASLCGLTGQVRANAYASLYGFMNADNARFSMATASDVKYAIMTYFYGSQQKPAELCEFDNQMLGTFHSTMEEKCEGAFFMRGLATNVYIPEADTLTGVWTPDDAHIWMMPNNAVVHNSVISQDTYRVDNVHNKYEYHFNKVQGQPKGISLAADIAHSIDAYVASEMQIRCAYHRTGYLSRIVAARDILKRKGYATVNRVASNDICVSLGSFEQIHHQLGLPFRFRDHAYLHAMYYMLNNLLNTPAFDQVSVFDEFTCLPNYVGHMKQHYINIMAEIADSSLASQICTMLVGEPITVPKLSHNLSTEILRGDYAIN